MEPLQLIATCTAGLEACVKRELTTLGFDDARVYSPGRTIFSADAARLARANLWLRTANRILLKAGDFPAEDFDQLFEVFAAFGIDQPGVTARGRVDIRAGEQLDECDVGSAVGKLRQEREGIAEPQQIADDDAHALGGQ